jgi:hypothetical protein
VVPVAPAFRRAPWKQADARLKAGATGTKTKPAAERKSSCLRVKIWG